MLEISLQILKNIDAVNHVRMDLDIIKKSVIIFYAVTYNDKI